ncbi:MAG TPA: hypothetical protein DCX07_01645 [Phycisphaerales bacterium]|nr:hypothetical protein [Phycisphaerales bacterium]
METIVCLAAHPDDIAYAMGGTLLRLKDRVRIHVLCVTKGQRGLPGQDPDQTAALREKEEQAACDLLGAELTFLEQMDGEVFAGEPLCRQVAGLLDGLAPSAVFTLWPIDNHPDHSAVSEIARKAVRLSKAAPPLIYYEAMYGVQAFQFRPDVYVDITDVMDRKVELIRCHVCQNLDDRMVQRAFPQCALRGSEAGCKYAEGFKFPRCPAMDPQALLTLGKRK